MSSVGSCPVRLLNLTVSHAIDHSPRIVVLPIPVRVVVALIEIDMTDLACGT